MNKRIYLNMTNKCNLKCPFCFMYSGPSNELTLDFDKFSSIIDNTIIDENFEVQLGGGETLLYPLILEAVEYILKKEQVIRFYIDTNGFYLSEYLERFIELANQYKKKISFKISINYWLINNNSNLLEDLEELLNNHQDEYIQYILSIRYRLPESYDNFREKIKNYSYLSTLKVTYHPFAYMGRAKDNKLSNMGLFKDISPKKCIPIVFATDGTNFGNDFIARMNYEKTLSKEL